MGKIRSKSLFFTTSPRTPSKMIPEIRLLHECFEGKIWNKENQIKYTEELEKMDFFEGSTSKEKDFSARDRINRAPKSLGFVDLNPEIALTEAGKEFVYGHRQQEIFLRQILKFQLPSPFHIEIKDIKNTFMSSLLLNSSTSFILSPTLVCIKSNVFSFAYLLSPKLLITVATIVFFDN